MKDNELEHLLNAEDFEYAIQILRWLFQPLGIWPIKSMGYSPFLRPVSIVISSWSAVFLIIPGILSVVRVQNDFLLRLRLIGPVSFCLVTYFKYFAFLIKNSQFHSYLIDVAVDWHEMKNKSQDREIMIKKTETSRFFMKLLSISMYLSAIFYNILLPLTRSPRRIGNVTFRNLPYTGYYIFFDQYASPYYYVVFIMQCISSCIIGLTCCGMCCISIQCVLHISGRCEITRLMIEKLNESFNEKSLEKIVEFQRKSLKFAVQTQKLLSEMYLVEFTGSTLNICLLGYYLMSDFNQNDTMGAMTNISLLISFIVNIFLLCFLGEHLTDQCATIGSTVCTLDWYRFSVKKSRDLFLIVQYAQRPVVITAGKMVNFSLLSFASLMKASAAYFNMLYSMS